MKYQSKEDFDRANHFGQGTPNDAYAQYFIGNSFLNPLTDFKNGEFPLLMLPLNRDAIITGTYITPIKEAVRY